MAMELNPLLLNALLSRSGAPANPAVQALLTGATPAETVGALPTAQELLGQLESANPTLGMVARYLTARRAAESEGSDETPAEMDDEPEYVADDRRLIQVVQRLEQQVRRLRAEREYLRRRNDACAAALGACYLCWGEDPDCPVCQGAGRPGFAMPDRQMFAQWVAPAIRTLQARGAIQQRDSSHPPTNGSVQPERSMKGVENE